MILIFYIYFISESLFSWSYICQCCMPARLFISCCSYAFRKYLGSCENKWLLVIGFRMMTWPERKSPKWRQFCDRKRIGFSHPIVQR